MATVLLYMLKIHFAEYEFKIKNENNKEYIFDEVRRKWVHLTSEEWVRQNFLHYLIHQKKYPASLIAVEKMILFGELKKRCDIVVYRGQQAWMIIECKETFIPLREQVLWQILNYNMALPANILVITNGNQTYAFERIQNSARELEELPEWQ